MTNKRKVITGALIGAIALGGITGVAVANGGDSDAGEADHGPIVGAAYDRATAKALDVVGEGRVTETEVGDEESYYQVEITKDDGTQVDVNLDRSFEVVKTKAEPADGAGDD
jgi:uncharacterized membrane protein YkoI